MKRKAKACLILTAVLSVATTVVAIVVAYNGFSYHDSLIEAKCSVLDYRITKEPKYYPVLDLLLSITEQTGNQSHWVNEGSYRASCPSDSGEAYLKKMEIDCWYPPEDTATIYLVSDPHENTIVIAFILGILGPMIIGLFGVAGVAILEN